MPCHGLLSYKLARLVQSADVHLSNCRGSLHWWANSEHRNHAALYYRPVEAGAYELELMALIDRQHLRTPFYGSRRMTAWLQAQGHVVNRKRVQRLMQQMGLAAIYPRPRTSRPAPEHRIYPYLLRGLNIERVD
jgi:hypothetical protein